MNFIKGFIHYLDQIDPYQEQWMDGEQPIITTAQTDPTETDTQIIEQLQARIDALEDRVKFLEEAWFDED
jgi:hypothetical protein